MQTLMDILVIARRDLIRAVREKSRFYASVVRPVIWLFLLGTGLRGGFASQLPPGLDMRQFIFPGMIAMNILFAGVQSGVSIIWDREFGFLKEIMVAPVSRLSIAWGKTLSGSLTALLQGGIVLALFPFLSLRLAADRILIALPAMFVVALTVTSLGILLAARMRSFEGFGTVNNFIVMPMFFLSGAMYPTSGIPGWLKAITALNPLTYGVDLLRGVVLGLQARYALDLAVLLACAALVLGAAAVLFQREGR